MKNERLRSERGGGAAVDLQPFERVLRLLGRSVSQAGADQLFCMHDRKGQPGLPKVRDHSVEVAVPGGVDTELEAGHAQCGTVAEDLLVVGLHRIAGHRARGEQDGAAHAAAGIPRS